MLQLVSFLSPLRKKYNLPYTHVSFYRLLIPFTHQWLLGDPYLPHYVVLLLREGDCASQHLWCLGDILLKKVELNEVWTKYFLYAKPLFDLKQTFYSCFFAYFCYVYGERTFYKVLWCFDHFSRSYELPKLKRIRL